MISEDNFEEKKKELLSNMDDLYKALQAVHLSDFQEFGAKSRIINLRLAVTTSYTNFWEQICKIRATMTPL